MATLKELRDERLRKLTELKQLGIEPYPAQTERSHNIGVVTEQFEKAIKNLGQEVAYLDSADFKKFWDADAKRVIDAVRAIGKI